MHKGTKLALILGAIPFITLVFALPLVNRIKPVILGLPFLLFWILIWVILTPLRMIVLSIKKIFHSVSVFICVVVLLISSILL